MKQKVYFEFGKIKKILKKEKVRDIFLVVGKTSFEKSGAKKKLNEILSKDFNVVRFSSFSSNPKIEEINKGLRLFKKGEYGILLSIGGGSSIDVAKSIKLFSKKDIPLVAVPTTAGSGSEATYFIVYYESKKKVSEGNPRRTLPNYAILDYRLLNSLPNKIMASSGIDALGQAIESYWSIHSNGESREYSRKAIKLLMKYLGLAVKNRNKRSLKKIMMGAHLAGKAINITKTTACHSLAYPMTSYFKIPHGHAVGLTLGEMLKFNYGVSEKNCLDRKGVKWVKNTILEISRLLGCKNPKDAGDKIYSLMKEIGLETKFSQFGLEKKDVETIIKNGFNPKRVKNNPRLLTKENLREILKNIK